MADTNAIKIGFIEETLNEVRYMLIPLHHFEYDLQEKAHSIQHLIYKDLPAKSALALKYADDFSFDIDKDNLSDVFNDALIIAGGGSVITDEALEEKRTLKNHINSKIDLAFSNIHANKIKFYGDALPLKFSLNSSSIEKEFNVSGGDETKITDNNSSRLRYALNLNDGDITMYYGHLTEKTKENTGKKDQYINSNLTNYEYIFNSPYSLALTFPSTKKSRIFTTNKEYMPFSKYLESNKSNDKSGLIYVKNDHLNLLSIWPKEVYLSYVEKNPHELVRIQETNTDFPLLMPAYTAHEPDKSFIEALRDEKYILCSCEDFKKTMNPYNSIIEEKDYEIIKENKEKEPYVFMRGRDAYINKVLHIPLTKEMSKKEIVEHWISTDSIVIGKLNRERGGGDLLDAIKNNMQRKSEDDKIDKAFQEHLDDISGVNIPSDETVLRNLYLTITKGNTLSDNYTSEESLREYYNNIINNHAKNITISDSMAEVLQGCGFNIETVEGFNVATLPNNPDWKEPVPVCNMYPTHIDSKDVFTELNDYGEPTNKIQTFYNEIPKKDKGVTDGAIAIDKIVGLEFSVKEYHDRKYGNHYSSGILKLNPFQKDEKIIYIPMDGVDRDQLSRNALGIAIGKNNARNNGSTIERFARENKIPLTSNYYGNVTLKECESFSINTDFIKTVARCEESISSVAPLETTAYAKYTVKKFVESLYNETSPLLLSHSITPFAINPFGKKFSGADQLNLLAEKTACTRFITGDDILNKNIRPNDANKTSGVFESAVLVATNGNKKTVLSLAYPEPMFNTSALKSKSISDSYKDVPSLNLDKNILDTSKATPEILTEKVLIHEFARFFNKGIKGESFDPIQWSTGLKNKIENTLHKNPNLILKYAQAGMNIAQGKSNGQKLDSSSSNNNVMQIDKKERKIEKELTR